MKDVEIFIHQCHQYCNKNETYNHRKSLAILDSLQSDENYQHNKY